MSTDERMQTTKHDELREQPSTSARDVHSALRGDLAAVWAISVPDGTGAAVDAVLAFAAAALQQAVDNDDESLGVEGDAVVALTSEIADLSDTAARRALFRHASRRLVLFCREPGAALEGQLRLLVMLAPVGAASVWLPQADGTLEAAASSGPLATTRRCKRAATYALDGDDVTLRTHGSRVRVHAYPLRHRGRRDGALVVRLGAERYPDALPFLEEFAAAFATIRERELLQQAMTSDGGRLGQSYERRLVRTAFDLHDGPLQDIAALAAEVRLLRAQIGEVEDVPRNVLIGRIDDVSGRLVELDHSLRTITQSLETSTLVERPLAEALQRQLDSFSRRSGVEVDVELTGSLDSLSMSQRIAVARIVQEALSNIGAHSGATTVRVRLHSDDDGLELQVADNGCGFDLRATAAAAARRGRLGIVGMNERVRLLGGVFAIESVPDVGTTVSASIPAWRPLTGS